MHTFTEKRSYPFLKWLLWWLKHSVFTVGMGMYSDLWKQGLFRTPSSPEGDESKLEPPEVGDEAVWYPFKPIPNVRQFEVELKAFDPLFALFGIRKRFSPTITFEKFTNNKYNRYMERQLQRLEDARIGKVAERKFTVTDENEIKYHESEKDFNARTYESVERRRIGRQSNRYYYIKVRRTLPNPKLYFRIVTSLLKHSRVFFMRQVMLTEPRWHREIPYHMIQKWWKTYRRIAREASNYYDSTIPISEIPTLKYHRTYIPKAGGKLRPLGVPTHPWRIYLGLWNKFLLKYTLEKINPHQHAYQPEKGIITVWRDIMENIIDKRNIYSYDLEKYFDKVDLRSTIETLSENFRVPWAICYCLGEMHKSLPTNIKKNLNIDPLKQNVYIKENLIESEIKLGTYEDVMYEQSGWMEDWNVGLSNVMEPPRWTGIPQGGSLSPLLAIILQESKFFPQLKAQKAKVVKFSDDGVVASDDDKWVPNVSVPSQGIFESKEKSFWVKKNGIWLKPLDFCGLRYDGVLDRIIANTRSGSRLELKDVDGLVPLLALRELIPYLVEKGDIPESELDNPWDNPPPEWAWAYVFRKWSPPKEILKHQIWGLLQSRLFTGSWELEDYEQDFRLTANRGSLVSMHYKQLRTTGVNVFTSTSWAFPVAINDLGETRRNFLKRWRLKSINKNAKTKTERE